MLQKLIKIYSTYTYINEKKNSRRKTQHSTHTLILEESLWAMSRRMILGEQVVLAGWTLEVGGGATHVAPQVSCSSCKKAPGKNRNVRKEDMTGQKRQKAHFPATRNGKLHADEPPRGKSVTPRAVPTVFYSREKNVSS